MQLGGPSYRIMEILGLETVRKQQVKLNVTPALLEQSQKLVAANKSISVTEPTTLTIAKLTVLPVESASPEQSANEPLIAGAQDFRVQEAGNPSRWFRAAMAHDEQNLAIAFQVADPSPWKNGAGQFTHAFIGGDCVDVKLDVPGRGPVRLLVAPVGGKDVAVYFQKTSSVKENPTTYAVGNNMSNAEQIDIVRRSTGAKITHQTGMNSYTVLITLPMAELGLSQNTREIKGSLGVIYSDASGTNRAARLYWSDKKTDLVSDVPTESRIDTTRFGKIVFGQ